MAPILDPWERRDDEGNEAFEAFQMYRDMGLKRSLARVAATLGKSETLMSRWSSLYDWPNRAREFDRWMDKQATQAWADEYRSMVDESNALGRLMIQHATRRVGQSFERDAAMPGDAIRGAEVAAKIQNMGMLAIKPENPEDREEGTLVDAAALVAALYKNQPNKHSDDDNG